MALKVNPANVVSLLLVRYSFFGQVLAITDEERSFAERIAGIIEDYANFADFEIEHNEELQIDGHALWEGASDDEEDADDDDDEGDISTSAPSSETDYAPSTSKKSLRTIPDEQLKLALDYYRSAKHGHRSFKSMKIPFRWIKNENDLRLIRDLEKRGELGTQHKKLAQIATSIFNIFRQKLAGHLPIHDRDLRRWALDANMNLPSPVKDFKAANHWLIYFKKNHRIVTRKITKFVTWKQIHQSAEIIQAAQNFVLDVRPLIDNFTTARTFNTDQSGFQKEIRSGRTLATKGQKVAEVVVQSIEATTHSSTIQPTISANGELLSPLFICLQEPGGHFRKTRRFSRRRTSSPCPTLRRCSQNDICSSGLWTSTSHMFLTAHSSSWTRGTATKTQRRLQKSRHRRSRSPSK